MRQLAAECMPGGVCPPSSKTPLAIQSCCHVSKDDISGVGGPVVIVLNFKAVFFFFLDVPYPGIMYPGMRVWVCICTLRQRVCSPYPGWAQGMVEWWNVHS